MPRIRSEEVAAAGIVAQVTGATIEHGPSGRHDADLTLSSGRTVGLEVTRAMRRETVESWAAIAETQVDEPAPELTRWWSVALVAGASVKDAHGIVRIQLGVLESLGIIQVNWLDNPQAAPSANPSVRAVEEARRAAGVDHAFSVPPSPLCQPDVRQIELLIH